MQRLAEWANIPVATFEGDSANIKMTTTQDFSRAEADLHAALGDIRTGSGYDVHVFGPGDHVMLGGVKIPHTHGLTGHSDADVVLHALVDAILGALADGDIGVHFPPSDPNGRARVRIAFWHSPSSVSARAAASLRISTPRSCAKRPVSVRIAKPSARASLKSPASAPTGSASRRPPAKNLASPDAAKA